jgi:hypothetical protein
VFFEIVRSMRASLAIEGHDSYWSSNGIILPQQDIRRTF